MRRGLLLFFACLAAIVSLAGSAASSPPDPNCTWGASSVLVERVNGQYVQSEPVTTGCIPG